MRAGIYGGTFNPIHNAHLQVVQDVRTAFALDHVYLVPAAIPPHKSTQTIAQSEDRYGMVKLALEHFPDLHASDIELRRQGPSYTIDTVTWFLQHAGIIPIDYFYIIGLDAFLEIHTWKKYQSLLAAIPFIVMTRPLPLSNGEPRLTDCRHLLRDYLKQTLSPRFALDAAQNCFRHPCYQPIYAGNVTPMSISATDIRRALQTGRDVSHLVPAAIAAYIHHKGLYQ